MSALCNCGMSLTPMTCGMCKQPPNPAPAPDGRVVAGCDGTLVVVEMPTKDPGQRGEGRPDAAMELAVQVATLTAERDALSFALKCRDDQIVNLWANVHKTEAERDAWIAKYKRVIGLVSDQRDAQHARAIDQSERADRAIERAEALTRRVERATGLLTSSRWVVDQVGLGNEIGAFLAEVKP